MRLARTAPTTSPIANEPAIAIAETFSVFSNPCTRSSQFSETKAQRSYVTASIGTRGGGRQAASPESFYGQTVSTLGDVAGTYVNVLVGRRMFFENAVTNRGGTLFFRI